MDKKLLWVWLSLLFGPEKAIYRKIYETIDIEKVYDFDDADLEVSDTVFSEYEKRNLLDKNLGPAEKVLEICNKLNVEIITLDSDNYPKRLLDLPKYPAVLYCVGHLPDIDNLLCITIVGTRQQSSYGAKMAFELGYGLSKGGALVISGGAVGNDTSAQKGALYAEAKTVSVLGCGINVTYPKENKQFFEFVKNNGAIITEYPPSTPPDGMNFPKRNRIMAALSDGTIVVEGKSRSGTLITANQAKELKRKLFAVPGPVDRYTSEAPNELIKAGAIPVTSSIDVLEQFLDIYPSLINLKASKLKPNYDFETIEEEKTTNFISSIFGKPTKKIKKEKIKKVKETKTEEKVLDTSSLTEDQKKIYDFMQPDKAYNYDMFDDLNMNMATLSSSLLYLCISGHVTELPGGRYKKNI